MSANRHIQQSPAAPLLTIATHMPSSYIDDFHAHPWHQIIFPLSGLLQSNIGKKCVILPHNAMLFIPAHTKHKSVAVTDTQFLALYLNPTQKVEYRQSAKSCLVTPFLKALILQLFDQATLEQPETNLTHLLQVLSDQVNIAGSYEIPMLVPQDRRLMSIFAQLRDRPDLPLTLKEWAKKVGSSERTLSRLCAKEFDQSFSRWRQNVRLVLSLQLLDSDRSIQDIALELGYGSDSAYIYAFRRLFNQTPNKYRQLRGNMMADLNPQFHPS